VAYTDEFSDFLGAGGGGGVPGVSGFNLGSVLNLNTLGIGSTVIGSIAKMIGAQQVKERERKEREKREALAQAMWMSGRREQAVGRWG